MSPDQNDERLLRSVALQNARAILLAQERAENGLIQAQEDLRRSNARVTNILESITDGFFALDKEWSFTYLNRKGEELLAPLRTSFGSLLGRPFWDEFAGFLGTDLEQNLKCAVAENRTVEFETFIAVLGAWFDMRAYPSADGLSLYFHDITSRKKAEAEALRQQEWFRVTLASIGDAVIATNTSGQVTFLNSVAESMTGWTTREAAGCDIDQVFRIISEVTGRPAVNPVRSVLERGVAVGLANHTALLSRDGQQTAIEDSAAPIKDIDGKIAGAVIVFHDVTERRRDQLALRQSEERFRATFNQAAVGIAITSLSGRFEEVNDRFCEILGYSRAELAERTFFDLTHPDDLAATRRSVDQLLSNEVPNYIQEKRYFRRDKTIVWSRSSVTLLRDADGRTNHFIGVIQDITQWKAATEAVHRSAERFQLALSAGHLGDWSWDARTKEISLGDKAAEILDVPPGQVVTWPELRKRLHHDDHELAIRSVREAVAKHSDYSIEYRMRRMNGAEFWISAKGRAVYAADGSVQAMIGVVQDVSESKRGEELQARMAAIVESSDDAILSMTLGGIITTWNYGAQRMFGYSAEELIGKPIATLIAPGREDEEPDLLERLQRGERIDHFETVRRRRDGTTLHVSLTISPIHNTAGKIIGVSKISRDITERKKIEAALLDAQEQLKHYAQDLESQVSERTASLQEMIGELEAFSYSISHDMRAPLRSMQGFAKILEEEYASAISEEGKGYLLRIVRAADRMDRLIQDILSYSRLTRAELRLQATDVEKLLRDIIDTYPMFHQSGVQIHLEGPFPQVIGAEAVLTQCFSNLLSNAIKFVEPGLVPKIRVWAETNQETQKVKLFFNDNGIGIHPRAKEKLFGIFQRLSNQYEGTGIGLAIVKKGIERIGGTVGYDSKPGAGSTFWLELKLADPS